MAIIDGNEGPNLLLDTPNGDTIRAMEGDDTIEASYGIDFVDGGAGDDILRLDWADAAGPVYTDNSRALPGTRTYVDTAGSWADATRKVQHNGIEHYDVTSGAFDDSLIGWSNAWDVFDGGAGNDRWSDSFSALTAGITVDMAAVSRPEGVTFADGTVVANIEAATLSLTQGDDTFRDYGRFDDAVSGGPGNDTLRFSYGKDSANGDEFSDREKGTDDILVIDYGDATRPVYVGNDRGLPGTRVYEYAEGSDAWADATRSVQHNFFEHYIVTTGAGDDELNGWTGAWDRFDGGDGVDLWRDSFSGWTGEAGITVNLGAAATPEGERYDDGTEVRNIERANLTLTPLNDSFHDQGRLSDVTYGGAGDDTIGTSGGDDYANGEDGDDVLVVDYRDATRPVYTGNDRGLPGTRTYEYGADTDSWSDAARRILHNGFEHYDVRGGRADDYFNGWFNRWDKFQGGGGIDTWRDSFSASETGLSVIMRFAGTKKGMGLPDGTLIKDIEQADLTLTDHDDRFADKGPYADRIYMMAGDDRATHKNGTDYVDGGDGDDLLTIRWAAVKTDALVYNTRFSSQAQADGSLGFYDDPRRVDFAGIERIAATLGRGDDRVALGDGADTASLGRGSDVADMGGGDDRAKGGGGKDSLSGGAGIDVLEGGRGGDEIAGDDGDDVLDGQQGRDRFVYRDLDEGRDTILKFQPGLDTIDLTALRLTEDDLRLRVTASGETVLRFGDTVVTVDEIARDGTLTLDDIALA